uniref:Uncharacterized protein n=1 Tax=Trichobilharzia regenti TaxID=157069 RepID=A0AA85J7U8_TRIRE|nr:unnamed protein product [Trichobilharzia regenti]
MYRKPYDALTNLVRPLIELVFSKDSTQGYSVNSIFMVILNWEKKARAFKSRTLRRPVVLPSGPRVWNGRF